MHVPTVLALVSSMLCLAYGTIRAALILHESLVQRILGAPMSFFDVTPNGRILSRFSTDVNSVDTTLPQNLRQSMIVTFRVGQFFYRFSTKFTI